MLMSVYGTLRKGSYNHGFLEEQKCLGTTEVKGFKMYNLGAFPCIVESKDESKVIFEVYEIDDKSPEGARIIEGITRMELGAGYKVKKIETEYGEATCYTYAKAQGNHIESGDWMKA